MGSQDRFELSFAVRPRETPVSSNRIFCQVKRKTKKIKQNTSTVPDICHMEAYLIGMCSVLVLGPIWSIRESLVAALMLTDSKCFLHRAFPTALFPAWLVCLFCCVCLFVCFDSKVLCNPNCLSAGGPPAGIIECATVSSKRHRSFDCCYFF